MDKLPTYYYDAQRSIYDANRLAYKAESAGNDNLALEYLKMAEQRVREFVNFLNRNPDCLEHYTRPSSET